MSDASREVLDEVAREYETTLTLPYEKPSPQWMLVPVGLIGAGKTTVVKPLAERLGLMRISADEIRKRLKEKGYSYVGARDIVYDLVTKYLILGYSLALDANTGSSFAMARTQSRIFIAARRSSLCRAYRLSTSSIPLGMISKNRWTMLWLVSSGPWLRERF